MLAAHVRTVVSEGTVLELVPGVEVDALDEAIAKSSTRRFAGGLEQGRAGAARPIEEALGELRKTR